MTLNFGEIYKNILRKEFKEDFDKIRKETAREILRRFVELSENPCNSREDILEELARQFGVEVE